MTAGGDERGFARNVSGYNLFLAEQLGQGQAGADARPQLLRLGGSWREAPDALRERYNARALAMRTAFAQRRRVPRQKKLGKGVVNGFLLFKNQLMRLEREAGRAVDVVAGSRAASKRWAALPNVERAQYNRRARELNSEHVLSKALKLGG